MAQSIQLDKSFKVELLKLDLKHADFLCSLKKSDSNNERSISAFVAEVENKGVKTLVFVNRDGVTLPSYIRREIVWLYEKIYGYV